jgi:hypothetical protein
MVVGSDWWTSIGLAHEEGPMELGRVDFPPSWGAT